MDTLGITEEQFKKINSDYLADVNDRSKRAVSARRSRKADNHRLSE